eukprot:scaffold5275_cov20-Tisochrysis_lutea.AAC.1
MLRLRRDADRRMSVARAWRGNHEQCDIWKTMQTQLKGKRAWWGQWAQGPRAVKVCQLLTNQQVVDVRMVAREVQAGKLYVESWRHMECR